MEWGLGVVSFTASMFVKRLEVDCAPGFAIVLGTDNHTVTPFCWCSRGDGSKDVKTHVLVDTCLDLILEVQGYWIWFVVCYWSCIWVDHEMHRRARHSW